MTSGVNGESWHTVSGGKVGDPGIICDDLPPEWFTPEDYVGDFGIFNDNAHAVVTRFQFMMLEKKKR